MVFSGIVMVHLPLGRMRFAWLSPTARRARHARRFGGAHADRLPHRHISTIKPWKLRPSVGASEALSITPHARFAIDNGGASRIAGLLGVDRHGPALAGRRRNRVRRDEAYCAVGGEETSVPLLRRDRRYVAQRVDAVIAFLRQHAPTFPARSSRRG